MSAAGSIPYHLRQNKAIERNLFLDLLTRIGRYRNISDYKYIGFGGPFLEDFKHLHSALRMTDMLSIESDENVFMRQKFNKPVSCIELRNLSSSQLLEDYDFEHEKNLVVWFDYASTKITEQLAEVHQLVQKLGHGDIFKITVNANAANLGPGPNQRELLTHRVNEAIRRLADYAPPRITTEDIKNKSYPGLLLQAIDNAARQALAGDPNLVLQPLTAFTYSDGQQMLTFTAILLHESEKADFFNATRLKHWHFFNGNDRTPRTISVPAFSMKERVHIEGMLPKATPKQIRKKMKYFIGEGEEEAQVEMKNFKNFYRLFPWYSRIVI